MIVVDINNLITKIKQATQPPMGSPGDFIRLDEASWMVILEALKEKATSNNQG